ncbi:outer membrane efflux protein [Methylococcus capsulatus str. Bath]|jgi:outer membrane protein|uniref:Protein CyaE n=1 Tax=Methylococcus capsulatus (strain ATCC 33009 / NCIMB 11132 / Bath) TaxID=243233 RepID=Q607N6_METCA|nr:TolC family protein [Methylococcus capsulatus]AAU92009.1 outer membrane efflux protein [Methylococcus capsulatus str. Bath]
MRPGLYGLSATSALLLACTTGPANALTLSLREAQDIARTSHPRIQVADLQAQASQEAVVQAKAAYLPHITQQTVSAVSNSSKNAPARLAAGYGLAPPPVASRAATGAYLKQLIYDFGRTSNLIASAELNAKASEENRAANEAQIILLVTAAYFQMVQAQAVLKVAEDTLAKRELNLRQVKALTTSGLKSALDVSFAEVNQSDAQLLLLKAQNDLASARAVLSTAMGRRDEEVFDVREEPLPPPVGELESAITEALYLRPDLRTLRLQLQAAEKFAEAEKAAARPRIELVGDINYMPWVNIEAGKYPKFNVIGGLLIDVPVFEGFALEARENKAKKEYQAAAHGVTDAENNVLRDVRVAWMAAKTAFERMKPAHQQFLEADKSFQLAQSRYQMGLSSIVELTQAQLNLTRAAIDEIEARVEYQVRCAELDYQIGKLR